MRSTLKVRGWLGRAYLGLACLGLVTLLVATAFVWQEARKEVVYLCGNFRPGISEQSVLTQLETGNFLKVERELQGAGSRITAYSDYNMGLYRCIIESDDQQTVVAVVAEFAE
ncbi:MAG: hypothetical protein ACFHX7_18490 [Pseudomonadota bacterium]